MSNQNNKYFITYKKCKPGDEPKSVNLELWQMDEDPNNSELLKKVVIDHTVGEDNVALNTICNDDQLMQVGNYIMQWSPLNDADSYANKLFEFNPLPDNPNPISPELYSETNNILGSWIQKDKWKDDLTWENAPVQSGNWQKKKFFGTRSDFANADGAKKGFEDGKDLMLVSMHNFVLNWIPTTGRGTYQLFNFDHNNKSDPLPAAYTPQGAWGTIQSGHELLHVNGYVIDWEPANGNYSIWQFDSADDNPLSYPAVKTGTWSQFNENHQLSVVGSYVLDWNTSDDSYNLYEFDINNEKGVLSKIIKTGHLPADSFDAFTALVPIETMIKMDEEKRNDPGTIDFMKDKIKHVVYYMIENRSLDHVCGWLYDRGYNQDVDYKVIGTPGKYRGVDPDFTNRYTNQIGGADVDGGTMKGFSYYFDGDMTPYYSDNDEILVSGTDGDGKNDGKKTLTKVVFDSGNNKTRIQWDGIQSIFHEEGKSYGSFTKDHPITKFNDGKLSDQIVLDLDSQDPYHDNSDSLRQMYYEDINDYKNQALPDMGGFATNNGTLEVMEGYSPDQLPVLNGLAANFAISDDWFCYMPAGTDANRAFSLSGNSLGHLNNFQNGAVYTEWSEYPHRPSIWKVLWSNGIEDFRIYNSIEWIECKFTYNLFLKGQIPSIDGSFDVETHAPSIHQFYTDLENGTLSKFSYLEPIWCATNGSTSYHPGQDLIPGERDLNNIFEAIQESQYRDDTLLIITFDEHGGLPDHVPPPRATNPYTNDSIGGFDFDVMGIRVPTILVSPHISKNTVFRSDRTEAEVAEGKGTAFCSTSILATLLNWFGVPKSRWGLGERTNNAPTFEAVITEKEARTELVSLNEPWDMHFPKQDLTTCKECGSEVKGVLKQEADKAIQHEKVKVNGIHHLIVPRMIADIAPNLTHSERTIETDKILDSKNQKEMTERISEFRRRFK